ncbi:MAG: LamG-like jellyroll fold domain-containing protein, partial [Chloroflexota bacterium]
MAFPPERGAMHWSENTITTHFSNWDTMAVQNQLFWAIPRIVDNPSVITDDPLSLLPQLQSPLSKLTQDNLQQFGLLLVIVLFQAAIGLLIITHIRSPRLYAGISGAVIVTMLVGPFLSTNNLHAYTERQQNAHLAQQQELEAHQEMQETHDRISGRNFDPLANPLADDSGSEQNTLSPNLTKIPAFDVRTDGLLPFLNSTCVFTIGGDCDNDNLDDDIELYELGTDPEKVDTDNDGISDQTEVEGFIFNGVRWYLDPSNPDSNGDGTLDGVACPELQDVTNGVLGSPSGTSCTNTDSDTTPDVFDFDDDGDGVPDLRDSSPLDVTGPFNHTDTQLDFNLSLNQNGKPIFVDFEIRPANPDHLYYTRNVLDWPNNDTKGQWTKNSDTNFVDLDDYDSGDGDIILNPLLEIEITYDASNPTAGLPVTPTLTSPNSTNIPDYSDLSWIDTDELEKWGISFNEGETSDKFLLWIPLNLVEDEIGDTPVTWNGRMTYLPQMSQTTLGNDQIMRMVWMIEGIKDTCTPPSGASYDEYCSEQSNWVSNVEIMQTYYGDFYLTGLTVREDHGGEIALFAEATNVGNSNYDDYLWHLADSLQDTFMRGEQKSSGGRFTIADIPTTLSDFNISGLDVLTRTLDDQSDLSKVSGEDNLTFLSAVHSGAVVDDIASILYAGEEETRTVLLSDDETNVTGTNVTVDLTSVDLVRSSVLRINPFIYQGAGVWQELALETYQDQLSTDLASVFTNTELDTLVAPNNETIDDYSTAQDGAISLTQGYYLSLYIGLSGIVERNGVIVNNDSFTSTDFGRSSEVATGLVQHMLEEMQAFYAKKSVITAIASVSSEITAAATALSATFATSQSAILNALGSARQGNISNSLSLALQELGNYYKTIDVNTSKFTDYVSLSEQFYISTVTSLGEGWGAVYSIGKFIWSSSNVIWGLRILTGVVSVSKSASLATKLWNSTKFWAVVTFIFTVALALYVFLSGDYDNQLEYSAAATQFAFTVIVAAIMAVILLIPVVGFLIVALIGLVDALMALICQLVDVEAGSAFDTWFCGGITGILIRGLSLLFSDQLILVDLDKDDRLEVTFNSPTVVQKISNDGFLAGNRLALGATISNTISLNKPTAGENLIILTSFTTSQLKDRMRRSTFAYYLQDRDIDRHEGLEWGDSSRWSDNDDTIVFNINGSGLFSGPGINRSTDLYLTESFNVLGVDCAGFIGADENATCSNEPIRDSVHNFVGENFAFDIIPATIDEFYTLVATNNGGYRQGWDGRFPTLADADGDGLGYKIDPNDSLADTDGDGLLDSWEMENGFDPEFLDADEDGLTDYWEAFYRTNPNLPDTDNDGLRDGEEFFHSQSRTAYIDDDSTWTGGWLFTYDFNGNTPLQTRVSASPIDADTDGDNVTDRLEFVYGYNPNVAQELSILTLNAGAEPIVAPNTTTAYTATIQNELNSRTALGLLEAEFPADTNLVVQTFVLTRLQKTTLNGTITSPDLTQTTETSVTIRAGAVIVDPNAEDSFPGLIAQYQFNETEPTEACNGQILSSSCRIGTFTFEDSSGNGHDALCRKNPGGSESTDCAVANGSYLEFTGVLDVWEEYSDYWTPVVRIEADSDFILDSFSVEVWVRPSGQKNYAQNLVNKYGDFRLAIKENSLAPFVSLQNATCNDGNGSETTVNSSVSLAQNQWNQIIATYEENTDVLTIYVNGQVGGSATSASCMASGLNERWTLGAMDQTGTYFAGTREYLTWTPPAYECDLCDYYYGFDEPQSFAYVGDMNRLQFFDDDLTLSEVNDLFNKGNRTFEFRFDEPPGSTTFFDSSGNGIEASCDGTCPQSGRPGLADQALLFDGNSRIDLDVGSSFNGGDEILGVDGTADYTLMTWIKPTAYPSSNFTSLFGFADIGVDQDGRPFFGGTSELTATTTLQLDKWQHVAWRFDADSGTRTIYINGVRRGQDTGDGTIIGFGAFSIGVLFEGWLDNFILFSGVLNQTEIREAMNETPLLSLHLDENIGNTSFADEAPGNNPATCSGNSCPQAGADGWMREAPVFDGNDELIIAATNELNVTDFSFNMWVKPTKKKGGNQWLIQRANNSGDRRNFGLRIKPNSMQVELSIDSICATNGLTKVLDSVGELQENQWNSIAATYDHALNEMVLYINGSFDNATNPTYTDQCSESQPITIGERFEGNIDEVAVYGSRLSNLQILDIYTYQSSWYDTVQEAAVIVDAEAPVVTLGDFSQLTLDQTMLGLTAVDADSELSRVDNVQITITPPAGGGSAYSDALVGNGNGAWTYYFSPTIEGQYTAQFVATDRVGNAVTETTIINVDDTPPTVVLDPALASTASVLTTDPPADVGANILTLNGTISDAGNPASGVASSTISIDIRDWQGISLESFEETDATPSTWQVEYPIVVPPYGLYEVIASAGDIAGNVMTETIETIALDDLAPTADLMHGSVIISSAHTVISGTVMDVPYPGNSKRLHLHFEENAPPFNDATIRQAKARCTGTACPSGGVAGQHGDAADFDGNDALNLVNTLNPTETTFTMMAWVNLDDLSTTSPIFSQEDGDGTGRTWLGVTDSGNLYSELGGTQTTGSRTMSTGNWYHTALTYDGDLLSLYLDGTLEFSTTQTVEGSDGMMVVGADKSLTNFFAGLMDELVVYDKAVSFEEIYDIANPLSGGIQSAQIRLRRFVGGAWPGVQSDDLVLYAPLDDAAGETTLENLSSYTFTISCDDCPDLGETGEIDSAVYFDGSTEIDVSDEQFFDFEEQVTMAAWIRSDGSRNNFGQLYAFILGKEGSWTLTQWGTTGRVNFYTYHPTSNSPVGANHRLISTFSLADGNWHHVAATFDGTTKRLYIDGVLNIEDDVTDDVNPRLGQFDEGVTLGHNPLVSNAARNYVGYLDDVVIYEDALTLDEINALRTESTWYDVTLDSNSENFTTWQYPVPANIEGLYDIDLRVTDSRNNTNLVPNVWIGNIDNVAPRATLSLNLVEGDTYQTSCYAEDLNIDSEGWQCPVTGDLTPTLLDEEWFNTYFPDFDRPIAYQSEISNISSDGNESLPVCDLANNCTTVAATIEIIDDVNVVLTPTHTSVFTGLLNAIEIGGYSRSTSDIRELDVYANDALIYTTTWTTGITEAYWRFDWFPPVGGVYTLTSIMTNGASQQIDDPNLVQITVIGPNVEVTKLVTPTDVVRSGDHITYTVILENIGNANATNIVLTDTLPSNLEGTDLTESIPLLIPGQSISYTLPATITSFISDTIINTAYFSETQHTGQGNVAARQCSLALEVTNSSGGGFGSFFYALENTCAGGTITFSDDFIIQVVDRTIDKGLTIDGTGHNVVFDGDFF